MAGTGSCGYCGRQVYRIGRITYNPGHTEHDCADDLKAENERLKLQLREARAALFREAKGRGCSPDCETPGYRGCSGCEKAVKKALGLQPGQSIYEADPDKDAPNGE